MKRGLFIGINQYANKPLQGCVNDVTRMREVLITRFDFPAEQTHLVTDKDATRANILTAFDQLVAKTEKDDVVVIHYAGHGSMMYLPDGVVSDESSGMLNTIVPVDTDREKQINTDITDDEINAILEDLAARTPYTTLIFDSCHSATISRGLEEPRGKERSVAGGKFRMDDPGVAGTLQRRSARPPCGPSGWVPLADSYVLLAGCRDAESSYETDQRIGKDPHGALSWFTTKALGELTPGVTYRELFEQVEPEVRGLYAGEPQHPQLEGRIDRELFGTQVREPMRFVAVTKVERKAVTLAAGAAMGVVTGGKWAVHAADTRSPTADTLLAEVEITEVSAVESRGMIRSRSPGKSIEPCSRALGSAAGTPFAPIGAVDEERYNSETITRYKYFRAVENTRPSPLAGRIGFEVKRQRANGPWETLTPDAKGVFEFKEHDFVGFSITNGYTSRVFVTLLDFSASAAIRQVYPPPGAREIVEPGVTFEIGTNPTKRRTHLMREAVSVIDVETFKLIVTTKAGDFWCMTQPGVLSAWKRDAMGVTRGSGDEEPPTTAADEWLTICAPYRVLP